MNLTKYANKTHQKLLILYKNHMQVTNKKEEDNTKNEDSLEEEVKGVND